MRLKYGGNVVIITFELPLASVESSWKGKCIT